MKLFAIPAAVASLGLMMLPALFGGADTSTFGCAGVAQIDTTLAAIRAIESGGDYAAQARGSTASGAYQFLDSTWASFDGYSRAWHAPPAVQDAKAVEHAVGILEAHDGDVSTVPVVWYIGHVPAVGSAEWDSVPYPDAGNVLTPRQYQSKWMAEYERLIGRSAGGVAPMCSPGGSIAANADGYAIPGPADLFAVADVYAPHAEYPAWDWLIPEGTPIYAIRGGRVTTVQFWPHNWWDRGCGVNSTGCRTCGIGVTIEDIEGNHWAYCHGAVVHVQEGMEITAGTQILTSGNTGRSGAPHLHIELHTPDGQARCIGSLLTAARDGRVAPPPSALSHSGCSFSMTGTRS